MINSAALYSEPDAPGYVSLEWLDGVRAFFRSNGLHIREYGVSATSVCGEGSYAFRDGDPQLYAAVRTGAVRYLELYCHSQPRRDLVFGWEAVAHVSLSKGDAHLGLPASLGMTHEELLRQTYALAMPLIAWRYGIAYSRSALKAPDLYAVGILGGVLYPDPEDTAEDKQRVGCWGRELLFDRRHLRGYFRDVYPANLLSAAHVDAPLGAKKTLRTVGLGKLTEIDAGLWLWTVPEEELPKARSALQQAGLLLCP
jgi:hypothetical protein